MTQEELKQRLIELIYKHSPRLVEEEASCLAARLIANGVTIRERGEWISVTDRLPEDNTRVLGFSEPDKDIYCYDVDGVKWWTEDYWNTAEGYGITHWMPLPEPPETEKGGD